MGGIYFRRVYVCVNCFADTCVFFRICATPYAVNSVNALQFTSGIFSYIVFILLRKLWNFNLVCLIKIKSCIKFSFGSHTGLCDNCIRDLNILSVGSSFWFSETDFETNLKIYVWNKIVKLNMTEYTVHTYSIKSLLCISSHGKMDKNCYNHSILLYNQNETHDHTLKQQNSLRCFHSKSYILPFWLEICCMI